MYRFFIICVIPIISSSTAQGGGGSFKNRKPIGELGCCESGMAERRHWWIERWLISLTLSLSLSFSDYQPTYLPTDLSMYLFIYLSIYLSTYLSIYLSEKTSICLSVYQSICLSISLSIYLSIHPSIYPSIYLSLSLSRYLSVCLSVYLSIYLSICKIKNKEILRDFRHVWTWERPRRNNSARRLHFLNLTTSETKQFCETSSFFEVQDIKNEEFCKTSFKNWKLSAALTASYQCVLRFFQSTSLKYCACHGKLMPGHTKCCACHAKSS